MDLKQLWKHHTWIKLTGNIKLVQLVAGRKGKCLAACFRGHSCDYLSQDFEDVVRLYGLIVLTLWLQLVPRIGKHSGQFILRSALDWHLDLVGVVIVSDSTEIAFPVPGALGIVVLSCSQNPSNGCAVSMAHWATQLLVGRDNDKIKKPSHPALHLFQYTVGMGAVLPRENKWGSLDLVLHLYPSLRQDSCWVPVCAPEPS